MNKKEMMKMETANINVTIRMDRELKKQMDELCGKLGMNFSTAVNIFSNAMVRKQEIPFRVGLDAGEADPFYGEANLARLRESVAELRAGKLSAHDLSAYEKEAGL